MGNICLNNRYSAAQASEELGLPLEEMEALYRDVVSGKRGNIPASYFGDLMRPTINGYDLLWLLGRVTTGVRSRRYVRAIR
jgi:hypothetical protein